MGQGVGFILRLMGTIQDKWLAFSISCVVLSVGSCPHWVVHKDIQFCHLTGFRSTVLLPANNRLGGVCFRSVQRFVSLLKVPLRVNARFGFGVCDWCANGGSYVR